MGPAVGWDVPMTWASKKSKKKIPLTVGILLGGRSKRFGSPKAAYPYGGKSLAAHLWEKASLLTDTVFLSVKSAAQVPLDVPKEAVLVLDDPNKEGPMAGIFAVLQKSPHPYVFITAVDMPFWNEKVVQWFWCLARKSRPQPKVVVPLRSERFEPLFALWHREIVRDLRRNFEPSPVRWLEKHRTQLRVVGEKELRSFDAKFRFLENWNEPPEKRFSNQ